MAEGNVTTITLPKSNKFVVLPLNWTCARNFVLQVQEPKITLTLEHKVLPEVFDAQAKCEKFEKAINDLHQGLKLALIGC